MKRTYTRNFINRSLDQRFHLGSTTIAQRESNTLGSSKHDSRWLPRNISGTGELSTAGPPTNALARELALNETGPDSQKQAAQNTEKEEKDTASGNLGNFRFQVFDVLLEWALPVRHVECKPTTTAWNNAEFSIFVVLPGLDNVDKIANSFIVVNLLLSIVSIAIEFGKLAVTLGTWFVETFAKLINVVAVIITITIIILVVFAFLFPERLKIKEKLR